MPPTADIRFVIMPNKPRPGALQGIMTVACCPCEEWGGVETKQGKAKHLSSGWLAGLRQERTWLNLYLECQQLNYYTAQRECVCLCMCMCVLCASVVLRSKVYRWMTHPPIMWLINHCSYHFTASSWISPSSVFPSFFFPIILFASLSLSARFFSSLVTTYVNHRVAYLSLVCRVVSPLIRIKCAVLYLLPKRRNIRQKAIKKLNFNKIIAFIFYHIAKLLIIMLLFTHCTGIFISHCTSYNAKGDINNNTLLLQDRWLHCGHSGPPPFENFFSICSQFIQRKQPSWIPHTVLFFPLFLFFFVHFLRCK